MTDMSQLEARVRAAVESQALVGDAATVTVSADEIGSVTLRGTLPSHIESHAAARAAREVPDVLNVINEIRVKDPGRSRDTPQEVSAAPRPHPDAALGADASPKGKDSDDEVRELLRESQAVERREKRAKTSISEELRKEHWGREPENPPPWDEPGSADR